MTGIGTAMISYAKNRIVSEKQGPGIFFCWFCFVPPDLHKIYGGVDYPI